MRVWYLLLPLPGDNIREVRVQFPQGPVGHGEESGFYTEEGGLEDVSRDIIGSDLDYFPLSYLRSML